VSHGTPLRPMTVYADRAATLRGHLAASPRSGERGRGSTCDLGPCRPGPNAGGIAPRQRYREGCSGEREPRAPTGIRRRATAEGNEPEEGGRRATGGRRAKGTNPAGKRETGGKPAGDPAGREVRPQITGESSGIGGRAHLRCGWQSPGRSAPTAHSLHQLPGGQRPSARRTPGHTARRAPWGASCASADHRPR